MASEIPASSRKFFITSLISFSVSPLLFVGMIYYKNKLTHLQKMYDDGSLFKDKKSKEIQIKVSFPDIPSDEEIEKYIYNEDLFLKYKRISWFVVNTDLYRLSFKWCLRNQHYIAKVIPLPIATYNDGNSKCILSNEYIENVAKKVLHLKTFDLINTRKVTLLGKDSVLVIGTVNGLFIGDDFIEVPKPQPKC